MSKKRGTTVNIYGDVIHSNNQSGGITAKTVNNQSANAFSKVKKWWERPWVVVFGIGTGVITVLGFLGLQFHFFDSHKELQSSKTIIHKLDSVPSQITTVKPALQKKKFHLKKKIMLDKKQQQTTTNIYGDVVSSTNQQGGITAHTVYVNERHLLDDEKKQILNRIQEITNEFNIQGKRLVIFATIESNAQTFTKELKDYLSAQGYNIMPGTYIEGGDGAQIRIFQSPNTNPDLIVIKVGVLPVN